MPQKMFRLTDEQICKLKMLPSCADVHRLIWFAGSSTRSTKSHQIHRVIHTEIHRRYTVVCSRKRPIHGR